MTKIRSVLALALCLLATAILPACKTGKLETGGAYAPASQDGTPATAPDLVFYQTDAAFDLAHSSLDFAFKFERENRAYLWKVSPNIKHSLDKLRPSATEVVSDYFAARAAYAANPSPPGLDTLRFALAKAQQISVTANALIPKLQTKGQ